MKRKSVLTLTVIVLLLTSALTIAQESFSLNSHLEDYTPFEASIPRGESTIMMNVQLAMPVSEATVPLLYFNFPGRREAMELLKVSIADEICTGEYSSSARFFAKKGQLKTSYFDNKIPWPESIPVQFKVNKKSEDGYKHEIEIYGETRDIFTSKKLTKIAIDIRGITEISDFQIIKEK